VHKAQQRAHRIVFRKGEDDKVVRAARLIADQHIAGRCWSAAPGSSPNWREFGLDLNGFEIVDVASSPRLAAYAARAVPAAGRKGMTPRRATR
jgi:phosphotransacetylase